MTRPRSRRRGRGSLQSYQTKAGRRWRFQIWIPIDPEVPELGEKKFSRGGFLTDEEADDEMQQALAKRRQDERFHGATPTLGEYGREWLDSLMLEPSTVNGYRSQFTNYIAPHLGSRQIDKVTGPAIGKLYRMLRESGGRHGQGLSANTVNKVSVTLGAIFDSAMEDGLIVRNPARLKKIVNAPTRRDIRAESAEIVTWSASQLKEFLDWNRNELEDEYFHLWFTLARTGMRRGEAIALQWQDIDFKNGKIAIRRSADSATRGRTKVPKSGMTRVIDADYQLLDELKSLRTLRTTLSLDFARPKAFVFGDAQGILRSPLNVSKRWTVRVKWAQEKFPELPSLTLHGLRHTHATLMLELGESPKVVQERLGHSSIAITLDIYSHVSPTLQRDAVDRFAALLG